MPAQTNKDNPMLLTLFGDESLVKKYQEQTNPGKKMEMIWKTIFFQQFLRDNSELRTTKSEGDSKRFRDAGNKHYLGGRDEEAIVAFNKAIFKAPFNSEKKGKDFSLAVANRSAALMRLGFHQAALEDVDLALETGYPEELRYKLYDRKLILMKTLGVTQSWEETETAFMDALSISNLTKDKRQKLLQEFKSIRALEAESKKLKMNILGQDLKSCRADLTSLTSSVDVRYEESRGRFVEATSYIPTGSVILVEEAAVSFGKESETGAQCDKCFQKIKYRVIPCYFCSEVSFCCKKCRDMALEGYHKWECGMSKAFKTILNSLPPEKRDKLGDLVDVTRMALRAVCQEPLKTHKARMARYEARGANDTKVTSDLGAHDLYNLVSHIESQSEGKVMWFILAASCYIRNLQVSGYFGYKKEKVPGSLSSDEITVGTLMMEIIFMLQYNCHSVTESTDAKEIKKKILDGEFENRTNIIGSAVFPTFALFNHGCDNNTYKYFVGNKLVVVASKNIQPGQEVTENYFPNCQVFPRPGRRSWLRDHYQFDCMCEACRTDLPSLERIPDVLNLTCGKNENNEPIREEVEELRRNLAMHRSELKVSNTIEENLKLHEKITKDWSRIQTLVRHPCKFLYIGEQIFWKSIRLTFGNKYQQ